MSERLAVDASVRLFPFLAERLATWRKNTLRERIRTGCVRVNGATVKRGDHALDAGDEVEVVGLSEAAAPARRLELEVLFEDEHLIAIDKPSGLLSVSTDRQRRRTALSILRTGLSRPRAPARLWPVHRLDRGTSGVLLFARSREDCERVRGEWDTARKTYLAVVEGGVEDHEGVIELPLWEDENLNVHTGPGPGAKDARTRFRRLRTVRDRTLLEVELDTGRRHQIRVHLAWLGHPVMGDERYGRPGPRLALHALRLQVRHPRDERVLALEAPAPRELDALLR